MQMKATLLLGLVTTGLYFYLGRRYVPPTHPPMPPIIQHLIRTASFSSIFPPTYPPTHPSGLQVMGSRNSPSCLGNSFKTSPTHPPSSSQHLIRTASFSSASLSTREDLIQPVTHPPTHPPTTVSQATWSPSFPSCLGNSSKTSPIEAFLGRTPPTVALPSSSLWLIWVSRWVLLLLLLHSTTHPPTHPPNTVLRFEGVWERAAPDSSRDQHPGKPTHPPTQSRVYPFPLPFHPPPPPPIHSLQTAAESWGFTEEEEEEKAPAGAVGGKGKKGGKKKKA